MQAKVYGIPNCGSVKKALASLQSEHVEVVFHDFKKHGLNAQLLDDWLTRVELDKLINRKGTTWRKLDDNLKAKANSEAGAKALLLEFPTLIKRPVVELNSDLTVGKIDFSQ